MRTLARIMADAKEYPTMSPYLEEALLARHPRIRWDPAMDCAVGDGWFCLLDTLFATMQYASEHTPGAPQLVVRQVKHKYGSVRVRLHSSTESLAAMINLAVALSEATCEECGATKLMERQRHFPGCLQISSEIDE